MGGALALSCAIVLSGHRVEAQDQPSAASCVVLLNASAKTYMDFRQWQVQQPEKERPKANSALSAVDRTVDHSGCSSKTWDELKACLEEGIKSADITTTMGYNMVGTQCVSQSLGLQMRR